MAPWFSKMAAKKDEKLYYFFVREVTGHPSAHRENMVELRVQGCLNEWNNAVVAMRDFQCGLNEMYGVNWTRIHKKIYRHEKKYVYALLYRDDLVRDAAENSVRVHLKKENISDLKVFDEPHDQILTIITGVKPSGTPVRCVFVDANSADDYINSLSDSRYSPSESARVQPWGTG
uniref:Uncharacterized protein n=1 Tax=Oryza punctata TaxID=4537 RepID=A0A0E0JI54_ORYPU